MLTRRAKRRKLICAVGAAIISSNAFAPMVAADGFYSVQQADQGHQLFNNHCAECHRPDLTGAMGPALIGKPFLQHWGGKSVETLFQFEHAKMPATNPGSLPADQVMAITAYILKRNGLPAGNAPLDTGTAKALKLPTSPS